MGNIKLHHKKRHALHLWLLPLILLFFEAAYAAPSRTTYQAKIVKPDGYPLENSSVIFKFTILDPSGSCILYSENYAPINMANTGGLISFSLGSGVKSYPVSAVTFSDVFSNITPILSCDTGGPSHYTPAANDSRKIVMQFNDGNGWQTLPAMSINAVPYAMYASEAQKLSGKSASDFVQVAAVPTCLSTEALRYTGTNFTCVSVDSGVTSASVVTALGYVPAASGATAVDSTALKITSNLGDVASATLARANLGLGTFATRNSLVANDITSALGYTPAASGTSETFIGDVTKAAASNTLVLSNTGVDAGTYTKVVVDAKGRVTSGTQITAGEINSTLSIPTCGVNQYLTYNGTSYSCASDAGASGTLASLSVTAPLSATAGSNPIISISQATSSVDGYLSSADWTSFSNKITSSAASIAQVLGYVPAVSGSTDVTALKIANNLSDVASATVARTNLGLGSVLADILSVSATADSKITSSAVSIAEVLGYAPISATTITGKITSSAASIAQVLGYVPAVSGSTDVTALKIANNLSDVASATVARTNLGLGSVLADILSVSATANGKITSSTAAITQVLGYAPISATTITGKITSSAASIAQVLGYVPAASGSTDVTALKITNNLSDVGSATVARTNLGLGSVLADILSVSTTANSKISSSSASIIEVLGYTPANSATITTAINNKITSSAASIAQVLGYVPAASGSTDVTALKISNNLSDVASATVARTNLGLGSVLADILLVSATANSKITSSAVSISEVLGYAPISATTLTGKITSSAASIVQVLGYVPAASGSTDITALKITNNLSDVASATVARTNLGLGSVLADILSVSATANSKITSSAVSISEVLGYAPISATTITGKITSSAASIAQVLGYVPAASGSTDVTALKISNNLSDVASATVARTNLGIGSVLTDILSVSATANSKVTSSSVSVIQALGYTPANSATVFAGINGKITSSAASIAQVLGYVPAASGSTDITALKITNNLSDVASATVARTNLGLGSVLADILSVSATANSKITSSAASVAQVLGYTPISATTITGKITSSAASIAQVLGYVPAASGSTDVTALKITNNLSDVASATVARTNLGLGSVLADILSVSATANSKITSSAVSIAQVLGYVPAASGGVSSQWVTSGTAIHYISGNVGVGTSNPAGVFDVAGKVVVLANGNIGLGVTNPSYPIHMNNSDGRAVFLQSGYGLGINTKSDGSTGANRISPISGSANDSIIINSKGINPFRFNYDSGTGGVAFYNGTSAQQAIIDGSGNMYLGGAGTPVNRLNVNGSMSVGAFSGMTAPASGAIISGNVGIGTSTPVTKLDVAGGVRISMESATCAVSFAGTLRYNSGNVEYCNGSSWAAFGVSGAGITSLNGSTSSTQSFAFGSFGATPGVSTAVGVHTINLPAASTAGVTAGLISNTDYSNFNNKITSSSASVIQALGYTPAASGALPSNALAKTNNLSDLNSSATARTNLGLGTLATANSIDLGTASATGTLSATRLPAHNGDVTSVSGSATLTLSNVGAGVTSGTAYTKVTVDGKGRVTSGAQLASSDVTTALGYTPAASGSGSQWTTSGTTINYTSGNVAIGTTSATSALTVSGTIESKSGGVRFPDGTLQTSAKAPYVVGGTFNGALSDGQVLVRHPFPINVTIPVNCTYSRFEFQTAVTANTTVTLNKCTGQGFTSCTQFGTAVISASGKVASFSCASETSFTGGVDSLVIIGPGTADTTGASAGWAIYGLR